MPGNAKRFMPMMPSMGPRVAWTGVCRLILGSKSWSRRTLLEQLDPPPFDVVVADIDEEAIKSDDPRDLVLKIALAKASALLSRREVSHSSALISSTFASGTVDGDEEEEEEEEGRVLLICGDAVVVHKGNVRGKPRDRNEARSLLRSYADAPATTVSSIVVVDVRTRMHWSGVDEAEVYFRAMPNDAIESVVDDGAMQSAGALRIEHPSVQPFIDCIVGDLSAVMGFSQPLLASLIADVQNKDGTPIF